MNKPFGRNQMFAGVCFAAAYLASIPIVALMQPESAKLWLDWSVVFVPLAVGTVTGLSFGVKVASIIKNGKQPDK